jgi:cell division cycle 20-like protein 1 (cofactor of APC complex)
VFQPSLLSCSQVTRLCDLGPNDSVCSVQWTREGSYISIGTHLGQVQVALAV